MNSSIDYHSDFNAHKRELFSIYSKYNLIKKIKFKNNGWTYGFRIKIRDKVASGASIGVDEIKIHYDIANLIEADLIYCVGVAFGLSLFNFGLARKNARVYGIDNYSERNPENTVEEVKKIVTQTIHRRFKKVKLFVGTSPDEINDCLSDLSSKEKLKIVFIDGLHTDSAARLDYSGVLPFIDDKTIILWHNVDATPVAFDECFTLNDIFDTKYVLRSFGISGIYFNKGIYPLIDEYLHNNCLIWNEWRQNLKVISINPEICNSTIFRIFYKLYYLLRWEKFFSKKK